MIKKQIDSNDVYKNEMKSMISTLEKSIRQLRDSNWEFDLFIRRWENPPTFEDSKFGDSDAHHYGAMLRDDSVKFCAEHNKYIELKKRLDSVKLLCEFPDVTLFQLSEDSIAINPTKLEAVFGLAKGSIQECKDDSIKLSNIVDRKVIMEKMNNVFKQDNINIFMNGSIFNKDVINLYSGRKEFMNYVKNAHDKKSLYSESSNPIFFKTLTNSKDDDSLPKGPSLK